MTSRAPERGPTPRQSRYANARAAERFFILSSFGFSTAVRHLRMAALAYSAKPFRYRIFVGLNDYHKRPKPRLSPCPISRLALSTHRQGASAFVFEDVRQITFSRASTNPLFEQCALPKTSKPIASPGFRPPPSSKVLRCERRILPRQRRERAEFREGQPCAHRWRACQTRHQISACSRRSERPVSRPTNPYIIHRGWGITRYNRRPKKADIGDQCRLITVISPANSLIRLSKSDGSDDAP